MKDYATQEWVNYILKFKLASATDATLHHAPSTLLKRVAQNFDKMEATSVLEEQTRCIAIAEQYILGKVTKHEMLRMMKENQLARLAPRHTSLSSSHKPRADKGGRPIKRKEV